MTRYIDCYSTRKFIETHNRLSITIDACESVIKIIGAQLILEYEVCEILYIFKDEKINKLLESEFEKNTIRFERRIVPKVVYDYYFAETNGIVEEVGDEIKQKEYYEGIKDDSTDKLKMKLFVIQQEIRN